MTFGDNFMLEGLRLPSVRERVEAAAARLMRIDPRISLCAAVPTATVMWGARGRRAFSLNLWAVCRARSSRGDAGGLGWRSDRRLIPVEGEVRQDSGFQLLRRGEGFSGRAGRRWDCSGG